MAFGAARPRRWRDAEKRWAEIGTRGRPVPKSARQDGAQAFAVVQPLARTPAQRSLCRASAAGGLSLARGVQADRDRRQVPPAKTRAAYRRSRRGARRLVAS